MELQEDVFSGFGEASDHSFYEVKIDDMWEVLENLNSIIETYEFDTPEQFWEKMTKNVKKL